LKLIRYSVATKREYRGARSAEAFQNYLNEQLADPVNRLNSVYHINEFDVRILVNLFLDYGFSNHEFYLVC
jgi:hypothetical protein